MKPENEQKPFWSTLPGILTGCGAMITALAALIGSCVGGVALFKKEPTPSPSAIVAPLAPDTNYIVIEKIQLPDSPGISKDDEKAVAELIVAANRAEILAVFYQDTSYLDQYYAGQALQTMQQVVEDVKLSGQIVLYEFDLDKSYYVSMNLKNNVLSIDECEYWQTSYFDLDGNLVGNDELSLTPQTISIELLGDEVYITAISFYQNNAFCTS
ncbi:MAG TPA: hypothetical protein PK078_15080 [Anaerolineales bacterium]|nr:hypothetical protein [Anaerolineales bacterium]